MYASPATKDWPRHSLKSSVSSALAVEPTLDAIIALVGQHPYLVSVGGGASGSDVWSSTVIRSDVKAPPTVPADEVQVELERIHDEATPGEISQTIEFIGALASDVVAPTAAGIADHPIVQGLLDPASLIKLLIAAGVVIAAVMLIARKGL